MNYQPFFEISVRHDYFIDGLCKCLDFVPTEETRKIILSSGLLLRDTVSGISVAYNESELEKLQQYTLDEDEPLALEFKVYAQPPEFKGFTLPFRGERSEVLYFNAEQENLLTGDSLYLHSGKYTSEENILLADAHQFNKAFSSQDKVSPPDLFIRIEMNGAASAFFDDALNPIQRQCVIQLEPRSTIWKYFLLGPASTEGVYIYDPSNNVEFVPGERVELANKQDTITFFSKESIPFAERYSVRFQLKEKSFDGDKVRIKRLPVARLNQAGKEVNDGQCVVSEIYVNS